MTQLELWKRVREVENPVQMEIAVCISDFRLALTLVAPVVQTW